MKQVSRTKRSPDPRALIEAMISAGIEFKRTAGGAWLAWGLNGEAVGDELRDWFLNADERAVADALAKIEANLNDWLALGRSAVQ